MKEKWSKGKHAGCVVSDTPNAHGNQTETTEYYGGYLIAESIPREIHVNLIAAAPDLLEACEEILALGQKELEYLDKGIGTLTEKRAWLKVRAAIAKAKGEL